MDYQPLYLKLREFLSVPMTTDIGGLEALRYELAEAKANALFELLEARGKALIPKDKEYTDLDRKTMLDGLTALKQQNYTFLCSLDEIVSDRIKLRMVDPVNQGLSHLGTD